MNLTGATAAAQWRNLAIVVVLLLVSAAIGGTIGRLGFWAGILLIVAALISHANNLPFAGIASSNPLSTKVSNP